MSQPLRNVNSRMYNVAPAVEAAWDTLFSHLQTATNIPLTVIRHAFPSPIEALWAQPNLAAVLMCGYPFARAAPRPKLLAAPVPAPAHYADQSIYFTHLLVAEDSPFQTIEDSFGHRLSWTIKNSQSGYNAVRTFLLPYWKKAGKNLYRASIGPIGTFIVGVEGVRADEIDVVPIDSFSYDLMRRYVPEKVAGMRILATTQASPFPPLVAGHDCPPEVVKALRQALFVAHEEISLQPVFETIMIKRFEKTSPAVYETMLEEANTAEAAGYPHPA